MIADDITFRPAWRLSDPDIIRDAKRLWESEGIPSAYTAGREKELCAAAYCEGEIAAVSSAEIFYFSVLRHTFFAYRCLISSRFRQRDLAWKITEFSEKLLHEWAKQNPDPRILGLLLIIETEKFAIPQRQPVKEKYGLALNFVGYSPEGHQVRIVWFDDAELEARP